MCFNSNVYAQTKAESYMMDEMEELVMATKKKNARILDPTSSVDLDEDDILKKSKGWNKSIDSDGDITYTSYTNEADVKKRKFHLLGLANSRKYGKVETKVYDIVDPGKERLIVSKGTLAIDKLQLNSTLTSHDKELLFEEPFKINKFSSMKMDDHGLELVTSCIGVDIPQKEIRFKDQCKKDCDDVESEVFNLSKHKDMIDTFSEMRGCYTLNQNACEKVDNILSNKDFKSLFKDLEKRAECSEILAKSNQIEKDLRNLSDLLAKDLNDNHESAVSSVKKYLPALKEKFSDGFTYPEAVDYTEESKNIKAGSMKLFLYKKSLNQLNDICKEHRSGFRNRASRVSQASSQSVPEATRAKETSVLQE